MSSHASEGAQQPEASEGETPARGSPAAPAEIAATADVGHAEALPADTAPTAPDTAATADAGPMTMVLDPELEAGAGASHDGGRSAGEPFDREPFAGESRGEPFERGPFERGPFEPFREEPFEREPFHKEPFEREPFREEPFEPEPFHEEPFHEEPFHEEPFREEPFEPEPFHEEPFREEPFEPEPFREEPFDEEPEPVSKLAIAALVTSVVALVPVAVALGIGALVGIGRSGRRGRGMALTALFASAAWLIVGGAFGTIAALTHGFHKPVTIKYRESAVFKLREGNCIDSPNGQLVSVLPCSSPHEAEVFGTFSLPAATWPGTATVATAARTGCASRLAGYINPQLAISLAQSYVYPNRVAWAAGTRTVVCEVHASSGQLTGSVRGAT